MSFWTKKEHIHVERDDSGKVIRMTSSTDRDERTIRPLTDETKSLIRHYKGSHPGMWTNIKSDLQERSWDARGQRNREETAYHEAYQEGRVKRATKQGFNRGMGQIDRPIPRRPQRQQTKIVYVNRQQKKRHKTIKRVDPYANLVFDPWKGHLVRR